MTTVLNFLLWLLGLITGKSAQEKLGQAETTAAAQETILKEVKRVDDTEALSARIGDDALRVQLARFKRPD